MKSIVPDLLIFFLDWCALIFSEFRDTGNKYKMKVRSRVANLGDLRNPSLRQNVISGAITPSQIAVMTTEVCVCVCVCGRGDIY